MIEAHDESLTAVSERVGIACADRYYIETLGYRMTEKNFRAAVLEISRGLIAAIQSRGQGLEASESTAARRAAAFAFYERMNFLCRTVSDGGEA